MAALLAGVCAAAGLGCSSRGRAATDAGGTSSGATAGGGGFKGANGGAGGQAAAAASGGVGGEVAVPASGGAGASLAGVTDGGAADRPLGGGSGGATEGSGGTPNPCSASGGTGWMDGSGGAPGSGGHAADLCCHEPPSCLPASACGNGLRDACTAPSGADPCPLYSFGEECDGSDLAGVTCASLGFGSGQLACSRECRIDRSPCRTCAAGAAGVSRCAVVPASAYTFPSIAANDDGTALAWIERTPDSAWQVDFSLLSPSLEDVHSAHLPGATFARSEQEGVPNAQIAALPSGWVILATFGHKMWLYTLDKAGALTATNVVDSMTELPISSAFIVSQPNGGPMVIWGALDIYSAFVSADGLHVTAPTKVSVGLETVGGIPPGLTSAAFAAGQFQAVVLGNCDMASACVQIVSIARDGSRTVAFPATGVTGPWGARLVSGADDLRLYAGSNCGTTGAIDPCLVYERLTPAGAVELAPKVLNHAAAALLPNAALAWGSDSYLSSDSATRSSALVHAGLDGTFIGEPSVIARGGSDGAVIVRQGTNVVAAWLADGPPTRIEMALLAAAPTSPTSK